VPNGSRRPKGTGHWLNSSVRWTVPGKPPRKPCGAATGAISWRGCATAGATNLPAPDSAIALTSRLSGPVSASACRCHLPAAKHAERVGKGPARFRSYLVGDTQCQRTNVLRLHGECERPSLPKRTELLACFLDAALSLDLIWRCHSRPHASTWRRPPGMAKTEISCEEVT
jgi:hypothetical protein